MPSIKELKAFNFHNWIEQNKEKLKPPVGNAQVWEDGEMMVTVVGGPNNRRDYHDDPTEEFFYQLKGDIFLRLIETPGKPPIEVPIKEGEIFLLPKHMRHSPQRLQAGSVGVVVEMPRPTAHWMALSGIARSAISLCIALKSSSRVSCVTCPLCSSSSTAMKISASANIAAPFIPVNSRNASHRYSQSFLSTRVARSGGALWNSELAVDQAHRARQSRDHVRRSVFSPHLLRVLGSGGPPAGNGSRWSRDSSSLGDTSSICV